MYDGKKCAIFSEWGVLKFDGELETEVMEVVPLAGVNKYLVMNTSGMKEVRLVK